MWAASLRDDDTMRVLVKHGADPTLRDWEDRTALERFRVHIAQLLRVDVTEIVRPKAFKRYSDYVAVISDKPGGTDLLSVLRTKRTVPLVEAAPLLEKIADICDRLCAAGLPGALPTLYVVAADGKLYAVAVDAGLDDDAPWPKGRRDAANSGGLAP